MADTPSLNATLEAKVEYLLDRQAILDCVNRYSRGLDRHDVDITLKAFHPDALDIHGHAINDMSTFAQWGNELHDAKFRIHTHNITTHNCEIDGDTAHTETYVLAGLRLTEKDEIWFLGGRYIDRVEKRDGTWGIALRRTLIDWLLSADAAPETDPWFLAQGYPKGVSNHEDLSYMRPLRRPD